MNTKTCDYCAKPIHSNYKRQRCCGAAECKSAHRARMRKRCTWALTCQSCATEYEATRKDGKYCPDCRGSALSASRSPENVEVYSAMRSGSSQDVLGAIYRRCTHTSTDCWEWQGFRGPTGYGYISTGRAKDRPQELIHRLTYEYATGIKPTGMTVHHTCANTQCCNPDHLQLASHRENMAEMHARRTYEAQIAELRNALAEHDPNHPLLKA